jgi:hypothetical protein
MAKNKITVTVLVILLSLVLTLSCAKSADDNIDGADITQEKSSENAENETEDKNARPTQKPDVPENTYGGRTFSLFVHEFSRLDIDPQQESETGEIVDDARYLRNKYIEEIYDVRLNWLLESNRGTFATKAQALIKAGDTTN